MLTLILLVTCVLLLGTQYTFLIFIAAAFIYTFPVQSILFLVVLGFLVWQGKRLKKILTRYIKEKFNDY